MFLNDEATEWSPPGYPCVGLRERTMTQSFGYLLLYEPVRSGAVKIYLDWSDWAMRRCGDARFRSIASSRRRRSSAFTLASGFGDLEARANGIQCPMDCMSSDVVLYADNQLKLLETREKPRLHPASAHVFELCALIPAYS